MRLLLDQNLSPRLVLALADLHPRSLHVRDVGLAAAEDGVVWAYAADHGLTRGGGDGWPLVTRGTGAEACPHVRVSAHRDQPDRRIVITRIGRS